MKPKSNPFLRSASSFPFTLPSVAPRFGGGGARFLALTILGAAAHFAAPQAQGANLYWNATGSNWNDSGKWSTDPGATTPNPGGQPGSSDDLFFNITTVNTDQTITASGPVTAKSLNFTSTGNVTIRSNDTTAKTLTLTGDINIDSNAGVVTLGDATRPLNISLIGNGIWTNNSANTFTVRNDIGMTVQRTLSIAGSGNTTLSGVVSNGSGGKLTLTKTGAGTLTLSNINNSFTGVTTFTGGIVSVSTISNGGGTSTLGAAGSGAGNLVFDGGTLQYTGNSDANTNRAFTINADKSATIDVSTSVRTLRLVGANGTATNGTLTKTGLGTLLLTGANTYTGTTTVTAGTLALGATGSIASSSSVAIAAGATLGTVLQTTYTIPSGKTLTFGLNAAGAGTSGQINAAGLDISAATVAFDIVNGPLDDAAYVLATYGVGTLTGTAFASVTPPSGYQLDYAYNGGTQIALVPSAPSGYGTWAAANAGNQAANLDSDNDGVENGVEYFMGQTGAGFTASPTSFTANTATWTNGGNIAAGQYGTQFVIQTSTDLVVWTTILADNPNLNNQAGSVSFTLTGSGKQFVRLVVTPN